MEDKIKMKQTIRAIELEKLEAHPANCNRMSKANFDKLTGHIKANSRYEPVIVRNRGENFQIINGHHRVEALRRIGAERADCIVWDVDDDQTNILLATLNSLCGTDDLHKKISLYRQLSTKFDIKELIKMLSEPKKQIERLVNLSPVAITAPAIKAGLEPMVFFLTYEQNQIVEKAIQKAARNIKEKTKAKQKAAALVKIAESFNGQK